jgi:hypothetical protein
MAMGVFPDPPTVMFPIEITGQGSLFDGNGPFLYNVSLSLIIPPYPIDIAKRKSLRNKDPLGLPPVIISWIFPLTFPGIAINLSLSNPNTKITRLLPVRSNTTSNKPY